jgi:hypothetical protein
MITFIVLLVTALIECALVARYRSERRVSGYRLRKLTRDARRFDVASYDIRTSLNGSNRYA